MKEGIPAPRPSEPTGAPIDGPETARLLSGAHMLVRELTAAGHDEVARTIQPYLRPGLPIAEVAAGLRHNLVEIRSTEISVLYGLERRLDELIGIATRTVEGLGGRPRG